MYKLVHAKIVENRFPLLNVDFVVANQTWHLHVLRRLPVVFVYDFFMRSFKGLFQYKLANGNVEMWETLVHA